MDCAQLSPQADDWTTFASKDRCSATCVGMYWGLYSVHNGRTRFLAVISAVWFFAYEQGNHILWSGKTSWTLKNHVSQKRRNGQKKVVEVHRPFGCITFESRHVFIADASLACRTCSLTTCFLTPRRIGKNKVLSVEVEKRDATSTHRGSVKRTIIQYIQECTLMISYSMGITRYYYFSCGTAMD